MNASEDAELQRDAVEEALRLAAGDEPGRVHVWGRKLYGPALSTEHECTEEAPFDDDAMPAAMVVFHAAAIVLPGLGGAGYLCPCCGVQSTSGEPPAEA